MEVTMVVAFARPPHTVVLLVCGLVPVWLEALEKIMLS
jgi:hypothetical protein